MVLKNPHKLLQVLLCFLFLLLGLLPYLFLPLAARGNPPWNFGDPSTLERFVRTVLRSDYGTFRLARGVEGGGLEEVKRQWLEFLRNTLSVYPKPFLFLILVLSVIGFCLLVRRNRLCLAFFALLFLFSSFFFLSFFRFPLLFAGEFEVISRFYLLPQLILPLFAVLAVFFILSHLKTAGALVLAALFPCILLLANFGANRDLKSPAGEDFTAEALKLLPRNSLVLAAGDFYTVYFPYHQIVNGYRRDVVFVDIGKLYNRWYQEQLERKYPYIFSGVFRGPDVYFLKNIIDRVFGKRQVFVHGNKENLPLLDDFYSLVPYGFFREAHRRDFKPDRRELIEENEKILGLIKTNMKPILAYSPKSSLQEVPAHFFTAYFNLGAYFLSVGDKKGARDALEEVTGFYKEVKFFNPNISSVFAVVERLKHPVIPIGSGSFRF